MVEHPVCSEGNGKPESVGLMQAEKTDRGRSSILLWIAMQGWCSGSTSAFQADSASSNLVPCSTIEPVKPLNNAQINGTFKFK